MNTKVYEIGMLLYPSLTEAEAEQAFDEIKNKLGSVATKVLSFGDVNYIELAYEMVKKMKSKNVRFNEAHFVWVKVEANTDQIAEVKKICDSFEYMLRFLITETIANDEMTDKFTVDEAEESEIADIDEGVDMGSDEGDDSDSAEADDLTKVEGIGPKIAEIFGNNGIKNFADLKGKSIEELQTILDGNGLGNHDPATWPAQANLAFEGNWDELKALQEELHGGKE